MMQPSSPPHSDGDTRNQPTLIQNQHVATPPKVISCKQIVVPTTIFNTQYASVNNDSSLKMAVEVAKTWKPGSTLSVSFIGRANVPDAVIESVKEFAHIWSRHGNIFFNFISDGLVGLIRISFTPGGGNCSAVGTDCQLKDFNGQYTMNLDPEEDINERSLQSEEGKAVFRQIVLHEFGHVLGCVHEHQQPKANIKWDKDRVYTAFGGHSKKKRGLIDVNIFEHYPQNPAIVSGTEHDKGSIMHYEFTPDLTVDKLDLPGGLDLSSKDKAFIAQCYPFPSTIDTAVVHWNKSSASSETRNSHLRRVSVPFSPYAGTGPSNVPRSILLGVSWLNVQNQPRLNVNCSVSQTDGENPVINLDASIEEEIGSFGCTWLALPTSDSDFRFDRITIDTNHPAIQPSSQPYLPRNTSIPISFTTPYSTGNIPKVAVWIHGIDSETESGHDFKVSASNVDHKGFKIDCLVGLQTRCRVRQIGVTWLTYPTTRSDIYSGSFDTTEAVGTREIEDKTPNLSSGQTIVSYMGSTEFDVQFTKIPKVFMGFSQLHVGEGDTRVWLKNGVVTPEMLPWQVDTWGKTVLVNAQGTYIAVDST